MIISYIIFLVHAGRMFSILTSYSYQHFALKTKISQIAWKLIYFVIYFACISIYEMHWSVQGSKPFYSTTVCSLVVVGLSRMDTAVFWLVVPWRCVQNCWQTGLRALTLPSILPCMARDSIHGILSYKMVHRKVDLRTSSLLHKVLLLIKEYSIKSDWFTSCTYTTSTVQGKNTSEREREREREREKVLSVHRCEYRIWNPKENSFEKKNHCYTTQFCVSRGKGVPLFI